MKKIVLGLVAGLFCLAAGAQQANFWTPVSEAALARNVFANRYKPSAYQLYYLKENDLASALRSVPSERTVAAPLSAFILSLPNAEGRLEQFRVVEAPVMDPALAAKYPGIRSYAGQGIDQPGSTVRFDVSPQGFHAMILSPERPSIYIDPVDRSGEYYVVFSRKDAPNFNTPFQCFTKDADRAIEALAPSAALRNADDARLRTYRLALAATGEYSTYFLDGTETTDTQRKGKVIAAMNTAMTRANGIYERDFGIRMVLIANNDAVVYLNASTDPWTSEYNTKTQQTIDAVIGSANYDIGHLVHRAANNGNAGCIGCVCKSGSKGSGFTSHTAPEGDPFVVDYLTHEMGHQFGGNHTFAHSYEGTIAQCEPGSGSTIMGYAGITGSTTDIQPHSDDYFHARTIEQVSNYIKLSTGGGACAVVTLTGNNTPTANGGADYVIPKSTPFTLTGSGSDADASDVLTYVWEQIDARTSSSPTTPSATATAGPIFRSYTPTTSTSRTFPQLSSILDGTNGYKWEVLPSVARTLNFRFTVRDNRAGGANNKSDDVVVTVNGTAGPFAVTAPNTAVTWAAGSSQTVTWNVNGTTASPVSCANVAILLSTDGGYTFTTLVASTANDGSESITVPNTPSSQCRIKVAAVGNIFFDISNVNFTIGSVSACTQPSGLTASAITSSSATVNWTAVSGATSYDVDYKTSASGTWTNAATATTTTSVNLSGLAASTVYDWRVRTNCASGSSAYSSVQFTTTAASGDCVTAYEPNESLSAAATVATNTNLSAAIGSSTDTDWFKFTLSGASNLSISLTNLPADYDIILYNSAGTEITRSEASGTSNESIVTSNTAAGTYYVKVLGYNGANSTTVCYTLNIGATAVVTGCASTYDNSSNGTNSGAALIPLNTNITGLISPSGDVDYYRFVITTGGTITLTLTTLPADYDLKLFSSNGTSQVGISQNGGTTSETINYTAAAGTYYAQVFGYNGANNATNCYTLRVATGTATKDGNYLVTPKAGIQVFPNPAKSTLTVQLPGNREKADILVFDGHGRLVLQQSSSAENARLNVAKLASGVYMIKVKRGAEEISSTRFVKE